MFVICPKCGAKYQIPAEITLKDGQKMQCSACEHYFVFKKDIFDDKNESYENQMPPVSNPVLSEDVTTISTEKNMGKTVLPEVFQPFPYQEKKTNILLPLLLVIVSLMILLVLLGLAWQYREDLKTQNAMEILRSNRNETIRLNENKTQSLDEKTLLIPQNVSMQTMPVSNKNIASLEKEVEDEALNQFSFNSVRFRLIPQDYGSVVQIEGIIHNDTNEDLFLPDYIWATGYDSHGQVLFQKEIYFSQKVLSAQQDQAFFGTYNPAPKDIKWIDISFKK